MPTARPETSVGRPAIAHGRWVGGGLLMLAYAIASHALMTRAGDSALAMLVVLGPLATLGIVWLWGTRKRALSGACLLIAVLFFLALMLDDRPLPAQWLYLAQHAGVHFILAIVFGCTLRPGARPLVSALALRVHGALTPGLAAYTRQVTRVWTLFFASVTASSLALFFWGDFRHWSVLANLLTPAFTVLLFVGEYLLRYRLHPEFERVSLTHGIQAWRMHTARPKDAGPDR